MKIPRDKRAQRCVAGQSRKGSIIQEYTLLNMACSLLGASIGTLVCGSHPQEGQIYGGNNGARLHTSPFYALAVLRQHLALQFGQKMRSRPLHAVWRLEYLSLTTPKSSYLLSSRPQSDSLFNVNFGSHKLQYLSRLLPLIPVNASASCPVRISHNEHKLSLTGLI